MEPVTWLGLGTEFVPKKFRSFHYSAEERMKWNSTELRGKIKFYKTATIF